MSKELIEEAIEYLEKLQAESTQGEWMYRGEVLGTPSTTVSSIDSEGEYWQVAYAHHTNAHLIVALHRTIPALLEILQAGHGYIQMNGFGDDEFTALPLAEIALARAILGRSETTNESEGTE